MHDDELETSVDLVRDLLGAQFPDWADLPLQAVVSTGTANAMFRLGDELVVRLPLRPGTEASVRKEHRWLPELASHLPVAVPVPVAVGTPAERYPMPWSILRWFDGADGTTGSFDDEQTAAELGAFVRKLHGIEAPVEEPDALPGSSPSDRGGPLAWRDRVVRQSAEAARHMTDVDAVLAVWDEALAAPAWDQPGRWIQGDIASGNLIYRDGRLAAVIDWPAMAVGDPSADLIVAWEMFGPGSRETFRSEMPLVDDAMWARGRGWAISTAVLCLPYYEHTNAFMVDQAHAKIANLIGDS